MPEGQDIILYTPKLTPFLMVFAVLCLSMGVGLPFLAEWQLSPLGVSLFLIAAGVWFGPVTVWQRMHYPILQINAEGIYSQSQLLRWEEIDAIYRINTKNGGVFAVDISPNGVIAFFARQGKSLPRSKDMTGPQLALGLPGVRLPLPVDDVLVLIRERFSTEIERYHIDCPIY